MDDKAYADGLDRIIDNDLFKILSEPSRVKILRFLAITGPSDVGTVSRAFTQDRSVISRHLKIMADAGILSAEKKSRNTVYTFDGYAFLHRLEDITVWSSQCWTSFALIAGRKAEKWIDVLLFLLYYARVCIYAQ